MLYAFDVLTLSFFVQLPVYSKVDKFRKRVSTGDHIFSTTLDSTPAQPNISLRSPKVTTGPQEADSGMADGGYEPINLSGLAKADDDHYDRVGGDYGYGSVDVVTERSHKDCLPSLAMLRRRASEHVYDVVPEISNHSKDSRTFSSDDYDHIGEISTEKV